MPARRPDRWLLLLALTALVASAVNAGCSTGEDSGSASTSQKSVDARSDNPLAGQSLYVDPRNPAAAQAARWRAAGRSRDAAAMDELAARPVATWFTDDNSTGARVRALTSRAAAGKKTALLVVYSIPGRDCGSYSAGGAASPAAYRRWVRAVARGIGRRRAVVIVEPDAIPQSVTGCVPKSIQATRYELLRFAVRTLKARRNVKVYIDAGNAGWIRPAGRLVGPLRKAGVASADGFALNVSNFYETSRTIRYGRALSRRLGGAHFVIDTGRNGNGPRRASEARGPNWCNPPGRALGRDPTTKTGQRRVDAYLWVKQPGHSDGACRRGAPAAGVWWPEYALELVRNRG